MFVRTLAVAVRYRKIHSGERAWITRCKQ